MRRRQLVPIVAMVAATGVLSACTASGAGPAPPTVTTTTTVTTTATSTPSAPSIAPAATVDPLPPSEKNYPAGLKAGDCPYIATQDAANAEGDRIYRTAIVTTTTPVGCRFYFWCCDFEAIADIMPATYDTALDAYDAMVATGKAGKNVIGVKNLIPGVDAVLFQTEFYGKDEGKDWACAFATGDVMVVVHTQQTDTSQDARNFAAAVAPKFGPA